MNMHEVRARDLLNHARKSITTDRGARIGLVDAWDGAIIPYLTAVDERCVIIALDDWGWRFDNAPPPAEAKRFGRDDDNWQDERGDWGKALDKMKSLADHPGVRFFSGMVRQRAFELQAFTGLDAVYFCANAMPAGILMADLRFFWPCVKPGGFLGVNDSQNHGLGNTLRRGFSVLKALEQLPQEERDSPDLDREPLEVLFDRKMEHSTSRSWFVEKAIEGT